jgi:hypothetical protein
MNADVAALEILIDDLRGRLRRSRQLVMAGHGCAWTGLAVLAWWALHPTGLGPFLIGAAASLGGIILAGSSRTSTAQIEDALGKAQAARERAIDALNMRDVTTDDDTRRLP